MECRVAFTPKWRKRWAAAGRRCCNGTLYSFASWSSILFGSTVTEWNAQDCGTRTRSNSTHYVQKGGAVIWLCNELYMTLFCYLIKGSDAYIGFRCNLMLSYFGMHTTKAAFLEHFQLLDTACVSSVCL